jgi:hypothetical protein
MKLTEFFSNLQITEKQMRQSEKLDKLKKHLSRNPNDVHAVDEVITHTVY